MATSAPSPAPKPGTRFVARQPILTAEQEVFGYELLFRDGVDDYFRNPDADAASRSTLNTSMLIGLDVLCDGRRAFINATRDTLLKDFLFLLPPSQTVVEILETVVPDDVVRAACYRLKEGGYQIALDDFSADDPRQMLLDIADFVKIDLRATTFEQAGRLRTLHPHWNGRLLAEKVETQKEFLAAKNVGFAYFQGYFFRRPEMLSTHEIPANQLNYLRMWQAVARPELDLHEVERVIKGEASICYRLLRYLNSAAFGFGQEIHSIRHALSLLGDREVRRWIRLVATLGAGQGKSSELVLSALVRARFCELLSPSAKTGDSDLFLMGLLSLMDAILEIPIERVLENVPVDQASKAVLLGEESQLRPFYQLMVAQEAGDWQKAAAMAHQLHFSESEVAEKYWQAMQWAKQVNGG